MTRGLADRIAAKGRYPTVTSAPHPRRSGHRRPATPGRLPEADMGTGFRAGRNGDPRQAFRIEQVAVATPGLDEALVAVMAAGIDSNKVGTARDVPVDVIAARPEFCEPYDCQQDGRGLGDAGQPRGTARTIRNRLTFR